MTDKLISHIEPCKQSSFWLCTIPLLFLACIAYFTPGLDILISNYFFSGIDSQFSDHSFFRFFYFWAVFPAQVVAVAASIMFLLSFVIQPWKKWRRYLLLLILPMIFGAGIITHTLLKDHWGRPRPRQTKLYGGTEQFRPFYKPDFSLPIGQYKSFPCGHCTMGFYFFSVAFLGRRLHSSFLFYMGMLLALGLGIALSIARIAQGGHFFSDTLFSLILMWVVTVMCDYFLFKPIPTSPCRA